MFHIIFYIWGLFNYNWVATCYVKACPVRTEHYQDQDNFRVHLVNPGETWWKTNGTNPAKKYFKSAASCTHKREEKWHNYSAYSFSSSLLPEIFDSNHNILVAILHSDY